MTRLADMAERLRRIAMPLQTRQSEYVENHLAIPCDGPALDAAQAMLEAAAMLEEAEKAMAWRPIADAPKDGTWILGCGPSGEWARISWDKNRAGELCWCSPGYFWFMGEKKFTHWLPLPSPPEPKP